MVLIIFMVYKLHGVVKWFSLCVCLCACGLLKEPSSSKRHSDSLSQPITLIIYQHTLTHSKLLAPTTSIHTDLLRLSHTDALIDTLPHQPLVLLSLLITDAFFLCNWMIRQ